MLLTFFIVCDEVIPKVHYIFKFLSKVLKTDIMKTTVPKAMITTPTAVLPLLSQLQHLMSLTLP